MFKCDWSARMVPSLKIRLGDGAKLIIGKDVSIREAVIININQGKVVLEDGVFLNDGVYINARESIRIGKNTIIGQRVQFYDHDHDYKSKDMRTEFIVAPINVGENVWVGASVTLLKGVDIGNNSIIAATSLVRENIDANQIFLNKKNRFCQYIDS